MNLSIIILNWNAADDTLRCVHQILAWKQVRPVIWVVDNASTDGSVEIIGRDCPAVRLIQNQRNKGFAGGTNRGIAESLAEGDTPIMLLNNDAAIAESDVIQLLETLRNDERIGFVGPLLFAADEPERLLSAGNKNPVLHHQTRLLKVDSAHPLQPVAGISGTAIIGRADLFKQVGLLDEAYFFSTELADLCTRAKRQGYLSVIDSRARAYHAVSRSSHFRETLYTYYIIRNRFLYIRKFYRYLMKGALYSFWGGYSLALVLKLSLNHKASAQAVYMGLLDGWQGRFGGQNERVLEAVKQL